MNIQHPAGTTGSEPEPLPLLPRGKHSYYAEVPAGSLDEQSKMIDRLIGIAFDALNVRHLDVRVVRGE
jgi:hypothetical protein